MRTLKEMVNNRQKVHFVFYRDNQLWYSTECGFEFPVPVNDTGTGTFLAEDRAMLYLRWLRRHMEYIEKSQTQADSLEFR